MNNKRIIRLEAFRKVVEELATETKNEFPGLYFDYDYALLKVEFPFAIPWFRNFIVRLDSGYQGFQSDYECKKSYLPHKKSKKRELTDGQKNENQVDARERIKVEHSIGGLKRYRILSERTRIKDFVLFDEIIGVCAGLWNYTKINTND